MAGMSIISTNVATEPILRECVETLQHVAEYHLPPALDRRLLWLSENKESLTEDDREELLALVEFAEDRSVEKLRARTILKRLAEVWPHLVTSQP